MRRFPLPILALSVLALVLPSCNRQADTVAKLQAKLAEAEKREALADVRWHVDQAFALGFGANKLCQIAVHLARVDDEQGLETRVYLRMARREAEAFLVAAARAEREFASLGDVAPPAMMISLRDATRRHVESVRKLLSQLPASSLPPAE